MLIRLILFLFFDASICRVSLPRLLVIFLSLLADSARHILPCVSPRMRPAERVMLEAFIVALPDTPFSVIVALTRLFYRICYYAFARSSSHWSPSMPASSLSAQTLRRPCSH